MELFRKLPVYLKLFYVSILFGAIIWVVVLLGTNKYFDTNRFTGYDNSFFNDGWTNEAGEEVTLPVKQDVEPDEEFHLFKTVTEDSTEELTLLFFTDHTYVKAYVNGEQVYNFGVQEELLFGKTPGSGWQLVELGRLKAGDEIELVTRCPYEKYSGLMRNIRVGSKADAISYIFREGFGMFLLALIPLLIGVVTIVLPQFFFRRYTKGTFLNVGLSFVMLAIWSYTESRTWQLLFKNSYACQTINFLTFSMFAPTVLVSFHTMGFMKDKKMLQRMVSANLIIAMSLAILQILNIADYFETLFVVHGMMGIDVILSIWSYSKNRTKSGRFMRFLEILMYLSFFACFVLDITDFYVWDYFGNGFFTRIQIFILLICAGFVAMRRALIVHQQKLEQEAFEKMIYADPLTTMRNRRGFDEDIEALEKEDKAVTILYADINGLKYVNDHMGHAYGDKLIRLISKTMQKEMTEAEVCYRLGGDEFCVISKKHLPDELEMRCEQLNNSLIEFYTEYDYEIGISYGALRYQPNTGETLRECMDAVDKKMYSFKEALYQTREKYRL